ncbi:MAG: ABC transporter substrate-binding protein [Candidatus Tectimicrobiota bacterium]
MSYAKNDDFCKSEIKIFQKEIERNKIQSVIPPIEFNVSDTKFTQIVKDKIIPHNPDAVIISGLGKNHGNFLKQLRDNGYQKPIIIGNGLNFPGIVKYCGQQCSDIFVAQAYDYASEKNGNRELKQAYSDLPEKEREGHYPSQFVAQMFTAIQVTIDTMKKLEENHEERGQLSLRDINLSDPQQLAALRTAFNAQLRSSNMSFRTPIGEIQIDQDGEVHQSDSDIIIIELDSREGQKKITE